MEEITYTGPILILNNYDEGSKLLKESFLKANFNGKIVVVNDDGFLDDDLISIYQLVNDATISKGKPCYFNNIIKPDFWEISSSTLDGKITDLDQTRAKIYFAEPVEKRYVKAVDWLGLNEQVRFTDHYNKYGRLFARTVFNKSGQMFCKTYFSNDGKEMITENFATRSFSVYIDGKEYNYQGKEEFVIACLNRKGIQPTKIYYNSLDIPFIVSEKIEPIKQKHVLFWQEKINDKIPGNMSNILNREDGNTATIYVQNKEAYEKLVSLTNKNKMIKPLGFVYPYVKENTFNKHALICTNSDQIEQLDELVEKLPFIHFHIAAITEMSTKLMNMNKYDNVTLYPEAKPETLEELFNECDLYFDINKYSEIVSAVKQAFLHNHLIVAFESTLHNKFYVAKEHVFANSDQMIKFISDVTSSEEGMLKAVVLQQNNAFSESIASYEKILK